MIIRINRKRIKNWEYLNAIDRGYCLGFYWQCLVSYKHFSGYKLTRPYEKGAIFITLKNDPTKSKREVIEEIICDHFKNIMIEWGWRIKSDDHTN